MNFIIKFKTIVKEREIALINIINYYIKYFSKSEKDSCPCLFNYKQDILINLKNMEYKKIKKRK